ncbi:MAG: hypothetical protein K8T25_11560 [Planctomycetia bacterium]|nr:hypothetical protein [Planctomycetia bacterium]
MDNQTSPAPAFSEPAAVDVIQYRPLSLWGVSGLLAGIASTIAFWGPMLWPVARPLLWPVAGLMLLVSVVAMIYLTRERGAVGGTRLASVGLFLSLLSVTAAPTHFLLREWHLREQASTVGAQWLMFLLARQPYDAFESMKPASSRRPLGRPLLDQFAADKGEAYVYEQFLNSPLVKALSLLPISSTRIEHYETESIDPSPDGSDVISDVYAVSFLENGKKKSFFVRLELERREDESTVSGIWRVMNYQGGIRPRTEPAS